MPIQVRKIQKKTVVVLSATNIVAYKVNFCTFYWTKFVIVLFLYWSKLFPIMVCFTEAILLCIPTGCWTRSSSFQWSSSVWRAEHASKRIVSL